jgi:hypothetical protein
MGGNAVFEAFTCFDDMKTWRLGVGVEPVVRRLKPVDGAWRARLVGVMS